MSSPLNSGGGIGDQMQCGTLANAFELPTSMSSYREFPTFSEAWAKILISQFWGWYCYLKECCCYNYICIFFKPHRKHCSDLHWLFKGIVLLTTRQYNKSVENINIVTQKVGIFPFLICGSYFLISITDLIGWLHQYIICDNSFTGQTIALTLCTKEIR